MSNILGIFWCDIKRIAHNSVALIIILALCILPSFYARFYLESSWDPYGKTQGIKVAVVNNDEGTVFRDTAVNIGNDVILELQKNTEIWWIFTEENIAKEGVYYGKYFASIEISSGFSDAIVSLLDKDPQHPKIKYTVNEKVNAITPKITEKSVEAVKKNIEESFHATMNRVLMEQMNTLGFDMKKNKSRLEKMVDVIHDVREHSNNREKNMDKAILRLSQTTYDLEEIGAKLPTLHENVEEGRDKLDNMRDLTQETRILLDSIPGKIEENLSAVEANIQDISHHVDRFSDSLSSSQEKIKEEAYLVQDKVGALGENMQQMSQFIDQLNILNIPFLNNFSTKLNHFNHKANDMQSGISHTLSQVDKGIRVGKRERAEMKELFADAKEDFEELKGDYYSRVSPRIRQALDDVDSSTNKGHKALDHIEKLLYRVENEVNSGLHTISSWADFLWKVNDSIWGTKEILGLVDDKLMKFKKEGFLDDFIQTTTLNPERFSDFVANPIELEEEVFFKIPNYGSAMAPFFTILAVWVGCLLCVAMLSTEAVDARYLKAKSYQKFLGKWLLFLMIGLIQALIVSVGNLFLLGVYAAHPIAFVLTSLWSAVIFSMLMFSSVSTFWASGKALCVLFLVLQLSGSGGTFPVELSGDFFQTINPFLPFTYLINAMRETVGGIIPSVYRGNMGVPLGFFGLFLLLGIYLKPRFEKRKTSFQKKFLESGLLEH